MREPEPEEPGVHPSVLRAAEEGVPDWAATGEERRAHMRRVAELMEAWARQRGEQPQEIVRWRAAAFFHDALREAPPERLRSELDPELARWPEPLLHGPAAAARLRAEGVEDDELLAAVAYHTLGHPDFEELGMALYCADFLEPGRDSREGWRRSLRSRLPGDLETVSREILDARIRYSLDRRRRIFSSTVGFWNRLVDGDGE